MKFEIEGVTHIPSDTNSADVICRRTDQSQERGGEREGERRRRERMEREIVAKVVRSERFLNVRKSWENVDIRIIFFQTSRSTCVTSWETPSTPTATPLPVIGSVLFQRFSTLISTPLKRNIWEKKETLNLRKRNNLIFNKPWLDLREFLRCHCFPNKGSSAAHCPLCQQKMNERKREKTVGLKKKFGR